LLRPFVAVPTCYLVTFVRRERQRYSMREREVRGKRWEGRGGGRGGERERACADGNTKRMLHSSERSGIALGGYVKSKGDVPPSGVGLYLDSGLCQGSSTASAVFGNKGPIASTEDFECVQLEVWALVIPKLETSEDPSLDSAALLGRFT